MNHKLIIKSYKAMFGVVGKSLLSEKQVVNILSASECLQCYSLSLLMYVENTLHSLLIHYKPVLQMACSVLRCTIEHARARPAHHCCSKLE